MYDGSRERCRVFGRLLPEAAVRRAAQERVRREAEAVAALVSAAESRRIRLVRSPTHEVEHERNPRDDRRLATRLWLESAAVHVSSDRDASSGGVRWQRWDSRLWMRSILHSPSGPARDGSPRPTIACWHAPVRTPHAYVEVVTPDRVPLQPEGDAE